MKILFGWVLQYFVFRLQVICKSYRQVLTLILSSLLLLKQGSLDKFRLASISQNIHKEVQHFNWFILDKRNGNSDDLETQRVDVKCSPLRRADVFSFDTNTKLRRPSLLCDKVSLSHNHLKMDIINASSHLALISNSLN